MELTPFQKIKKNNEKIDNNKSKYGTIIYIFFKKILKNDSYFNKKVNLKENKH